MKIEEEEKEEKEKDTDSKRSRTSNTVTEFWNVRADLFQDLSRTEDEELIPRAGGKCCLLASKLLGTYRNRVESASKQLFGY